MGRKFASSLVPLRLLRRVPPPRARGRPEPGRSSGTTVAGAELARAGAELAHAGAERAGAELAGAECAGAELAGVEVCVLGCVLGWKTGVLSAYPFYCA